MLSSELFRMSMDLLEDEELVLGEFEGDGLGVELRVRGSSASGDLSKSFNLGIGVRG